MRNAYTRHFLRARVSIAIAIAACLIGLRFGGPSAEAGDSGAEYVKAVYFVAGDSVYRLNPDNRTTAVVCSGLPKTEQVILAPDGVLWLATWDSDSPILSVDPVKGGPFAVRRPGPGPGGQGFACDAATSNIFLGLYYQGLYVLDEQSGKGWQQIVAPAAIAPMIGQRGQLVLDPPNRHVYFRAAYNGDTPCRFIWRVNYDGSGLAKIVSANGGDALAIDPSKGHLYFSDLPGDTCVKRSNLDGSAVTTVMTLNPPNDICRFIVLDVPGSKMYLCLSSRSSGWRDRAIARANLDGSGLETLAQVQNVGDGWGLALEFGKAPPAVPPKPATLPVEQKSAAKDGVVGPAATSSRGLAIACFIGAAVLLGVGIPLVLWAARPTKAR